MKKSIALLIIFFISLFYLGQDSVINDLSPKEEKDVWDRIFNEAWEETVTKKGLDYLFEGVSLKVDTIGMYTNVSYSPFNNTYLQNISQHKIDTKEMNKQCSKIMSAFFENNIEYLNSNRFFNKNYFWLDSNVNFDNYLNYFAEFKDKFCKEYYDSNKSEWVVKKSSPFSFVNLPPRDTLISCDRDPSYNLIFSNSSNNAFNDFFIQSNNLNEKIIENIYKMEKDEYDENGNEIYSRYNYTMSHIDAYKYERSYAIELPVPVLDSFYIDQDYIKDLSFNELNSLIHANGQICLSTSWTYKFIPFENDVSIKEYTFTFYKIIGDSFWGNNDEWMNDKNLCNNEKIRSIKVNIRKWNLASISVETQEY